MGDRRIEVAARQDGRRVIVTVPAGTVVDTKNALRVQIRWSVRTSGVGVGFSQLSGV